MQIIVFCNFAYAIAVIWSDDGVKHPFRNIRITYSPCFSEKTYGDYHNVAGGYAEVWWVWAWLIKIRSSDAHKHEWRMSPGGNIGAYYPGSLTCG